VAGSIVPAQTLCASRLAQVVVLLPAAGGDQSVHRESSRAARESSKVTNRPRDRNGLTALIGCNRDGAELGSWWGVRSGRAARKCRSSRG